MPQRGPNSDVTTAPGIGCANPLAFGVCEAEDDELFEEELLEDEPLLEDELLEDELLDDESLVDALSDDESFVDVLSDDESLVDVLSDVVTGGGGVRARISSASSNAANISSLNTSSNACKFATGFKF